MSHIFTDPDLIELDKIWPLGRQLQVSEFGIIAVAGAYKGRYLHYLSELFPRTKLYGYEPQVKVFVELQKRFKDNPRIMLGNYGLATATRSMLMGFNEDGSSVVGTTNYGFQVVQMKDAVETLQLIGQEIDLLLLNCEASEWALIPHLLDEMMHHRIKSMAIQFHPKYVSAKHSDRVVAYLSEYYDCEGWDWPDWCYSLRKQTWQH